MSIHDRIDEALAKWRAGSITHNLQVDIVELLAEVRQLIEPSSEPAVAPPPVASEAPHDNQD